MARRRPYKLVDAFSVNVGSSGGQVLLASFSKLDAQGITGFLKNVQVSTIVNNYDGGDETPGFMFYLTTSEVWSDAKIITATACPIAGKVSLSANRYIKTNSEVADGNTGKVFLWVELTDITAVDNIEIRYVCETWGNFIQFSEE